MTGINCRSNSFQGTPILPKLPPQPEDIYQRIICDADLDYLGRSDMIPVSNTLYKELKEQDKIGTLNDWNKLQIKFISGHSYFTKTAQSLREVNKQKQIERIKKLITD
jgi:adenylate cyclase